MTDVKPYPVTFAPLLLEKVWGGRRLGRFGKQLPQDPSIRIGESWELADLASTSQSGAGGAAARSLIANGPLSGRTLAQAFNAWGPASLGRLQLDAQGQFPLLVKLLDASENLSVQVHPSPAYCQSHPGVFLKNEAWYILDAEPGAVIYKGIKPGVTLDQVADAARVAAKSPGRSEQFESLMQPIPVKAGDLYYLASGECHALGAGILVAEVQTPSDTTFRLYDWGRPGRQMHIEESIRTMRTFVPPDKAITKRSHIAGTFTTVSRLVSSDDFRIEKVRMVESYRQEIPYDQPTIWIILEGRGMITLGHKGKGGGQQQFAFNAGQTWLLPGGLEAPRVEFASDTVWLEVSFPRAVPDQIA